MISGLSGEQVGCTISVPSPSVVKPSWIEDIAADHSEIHSAAQTGSALSCYIPPSDITGSFRPQCFLTLQMYFPRISPFIASFSWRMMSTTHSPIPPIAKNFPAFTAGSSQYFR